MMPRGFVCSAPCLYSTDSPAPSSTAGSVVVVRSARQRASATGPAGPASSPTPTDFYLAYRLRRPVAEGRGYANVVAPLDRTACRFETVAVVEVARFGAASLERPALMRRPDGGWRLYVSCSTPGSKHWWVEAVDSRDRPTPRASPTGRRTVVLPGDDVTRLEGRRGRATRDGPAWRMWACRHLLDRGDAEADRMETWYAVSDDGLAWT